MEYFLDRGQKEFIVTNIEKANEVINENRKLSIFNTIMIAIDGAGIAISTITIPDFNLGNALIGVGGSLSLISLIMSIFNSVKLKNKIKDLEQILRLDKLKWDKFLETGIIMEENSEGKHR